MENSFAMPTNEILTDTIVGDLNALKRSSRFREPLRFGKRTIFDISKNYDDMRAEYFLLA
jgi:hypothetical protein